MMAERECSLPIYHITLPSVESGSGELWLLVITIHKHPYKAVSIECRQNLTAAMTATLC